MKKTDKLFDDEYIKDLGTSTGTLGQIPQLPTLTRKTYSKDTKVIPLTTTDEEDLSTTISGSFSQQKWGTGKPHRVIIRGKVSKW